MDSWSRVIAAKALAKRERRLGQVKRAAWCAAAVAAIGQLVAFGAMELKSKPSSPGAVSTTLTITPNHDDGLVCTDQCTLEGWFYKDYTDSLDGSLDATEPQWQIRPYGRLWPLRDLMGRRA